MAKYSGFITNGGGQYEPIPHFEKPTKLPPGFYQVKTKGFGNDIFFNKIEIQHDTIVELPSDEYTTIVQEMEHFLKPETKQKFKECGFTYKRSTLLYGVPGTGKTVIASRIANKIVECGGVVFFDPSPSLMHDVFQMMESIQPETTIGIIYEELDDWVDDDESELLSILDGEIQKDNIITLCTTNYIDKIPQRVLRPGRMSTLLEIKAPNTETRRAFLKTKFSLHDCEMDEWVVKTKDLTIDEIAECVKGVYCLGNSLDTMVERIKKVKQK